MRSRLRRLSPALLLILAALGPLSRAQTAAPPAVVIEGLVRSDKTPLPGATVTATNTATGTKTVGWTGLDGRYSIAVPAEGRYEVRVEMAAFAPWTRQVTVNAGDRTAHLDVDLTLASRAQVARAHQNQAMAGRGFQGLAVLQEMNGADFGASQQVVPPGMPVPGIAPDAATESVAISGNSPSSTFGMSTAEMQQRMQEARESREDQGYGPGGPGGPGMQAGRGPGGAAGGPGGRPGGPGPGGPGGGGGMILMRGRGRFDINRPHGTVYYTAGDSVLDASPFSLTGAPVVKPDYAQHRFGGAIGGPLNIPHIYKGGNKTFFFLNYNGAIADQPYDAFSTVPTLAERGGNFSGAVVPNTGTPVVIYDPATGKPFPNNAISQINPSASPLLPYIPLPNLPGQVENFHYVTSATNNLNDLNFRLIHVFGGGGFGPGAFRSRRRNNFNIGFHYHTTDTQLTNPFPSTGGNTSVRSFDIPIGYVRTFGKITNIARFDFNRNRVYTSNFYAFATDVAGQAGIGGVSSNPFDWGIPNLAFTSFASLTDTNPLLRRDQTSSISDLMIWNHGKHTLRWGGDFRRIQLNTETDSNARGSFVFTGFNTAQVLNGVPTPGTGFDFADFLLGLPQQTSVQYGASNYHFRANSWDLFAQEEWRVRDNLTLNLGVRYEYISPFTETDGRIVNLDIAPGFTAVAPVLPGAVGPYTGAFPASLVDPDRNNFAPRLGVAWKALRNTVVRAGYGINYNTGAYGTIVQQLAFQPPFSITQTNVQSVAGTLTLQNGFPQPTSEAVTNNYGANRNYRLGYVQIWNLDIQQEIKPTLLLNLDYTGTKGTRLDIVEAPNRTATGLLIPGVQPFLWENSDGNSVAHAGTVRLRKRLQHGVSVGGRYTFSKSIDNASTIGGGTVVVAQNALDLAAERGLSSFDQRHRFTADYLWELPFGHDKRWLSGKSLGRDLFGDWQWSGDWTIASGLPFTARLLGNFADVNRGTNGTLRADYTGAPISLANPSVAEWFNTAAFVPPPNGQFGDAGRNTIEGPGTRLFDMALTKVIPLGETRILEFRAQATNIFNTPQFTAIDTVVNSPTFGRVISTGPMRSVQLTCRYRF